MSDEAKQHLSKVILMGLPGTVGDLTVPEFRARLEQYARIDSDQLRDSHKAFLQRVIPAAEGAGVVLAIHPDDPPFPMFGLPRIAGDEAGLKRIIDAVDSPANGITFCSGSLGALSTNDLPGIIDRLGHRIHFLHLRSVQREADGSFYEADHLAGSTDMSAIMHAAIRLMRRRGESIPMRPDHGHLMLSDVQNNRFYPGYSLLGRMKGLAELRGLEMGMRSAMRGGWQADPAMVERFKTQRPHCEFDESKVPAYTLPSVLADGATTVETWNVRREEIVALFRANVFGHGPAKPDEVVFEVVESDPHAMSGRATLKRVEIRSSYRGATHRFELTLFIPNGANKPAPAVLLINIRARNLTDPAHRQQSDFWRAEASIDRGYAAAAFQVGDLAPDDANTWRDGAARLFEGDQDDFGALAIWAWGASRCADYLSQDAAIDASKLVVVGHSRGGKTALWAGANDERFAIVIANESGSGGAALVRRRIGETPAAMNGMFPHWFNATYKSHSADVSDMPVDHHQLIASIAPRAVYVASAGDDLWADPKGEFQSLAHANPAFDLFGDLPIDPDAMPPLETPLIEGRRGYHVRRGPHGLNRYDWDRFMDFADQQFR